MNRCSKCLLPDSMPGSNFNKDNECFWCQINYPNYYPKGEELLAKTLNKFKKTHDEADCLVGVSGGKDSSYALLKLKETFNMKVEAFTYDHDGMVPFAFDNAKKVCKSLGVKHHIVTLGKNVHLQSFRTFFKAWVSRPSAIAAGLTCVACKHLHLLGTKLASERKIPIIVWSNCPLEYAPFIAIKLIQKDKEQLMRGGLFNSFFLLLKEMVNSKELLKGIIKDLKICFPGCLSFSPTSKYLQLKFPQVKHLFFYDYINWIPDEIIKILTSSTGWEKPTDIPDDWHSDCVFNVFKEYMFQKEIGVSYTDSFLSSQIRYGIITREEAFQKLIDSKAHFTKQLPNALKFVDLEILKPLIDFSCFDIKGN